MPAMHPVAGFVITLLLVVKGSLIIITLGSVWLGTRYAIRKHGYDKAHTQLNVDRLLNDINLIKNDIGDMKAHIADLTIKAHDMMRLRRIENEKTGK